MPSTKNHQSQRDLGNICLCFCFFENHFVALLLMFLKGLDKDVLPGPHLENTVCPFKENHSARLREDVHSSVLLTSHIRQKHLHNISPGPPGGLMSRGGPARWRIRQAKCEIKQQMRPCSLTLVVVEVDGDRDWEGGEGVKEGRVQKGTGDTNRINIDDFLPLEHFIAFAFF